VQLQSRCAHEARDDDLGAELAAQLDQVDIVNQPDRRKRAADADVVSREPLPAPTTTSVATQIASPPSRAICLDAGQPRVAQAESPGQAPCALSPRLRASARANGRANNAAASLTASLIVPAGMGTPRCFGALTVATEYRRRRPGNATSCRFARRRRTLIRPGRSSAQRLREGPASSAGTRIPVTPCDDVGPPRRLPDSPSSGQGLGNATVFLVAGRQCDDVDCGVDIPQVVSPSGEADAIAQPASSDVSFGI
jgi:hypothetical protein